MVSIGIDISKGKSTVCFLKPYGEVLHKPFEIQHTESGLNHLLELISSVNEDARVVMEATGSYHVPVLMYLKEHGIFVAVVNPLVMSKYVNQSIRKGKTDKLDSIKIANYGLDHWFHLIDYNPTATIYEELKVLNKQYLSYLSMRVHAKQTLTNILDRTMPGIKTQLMNRSDVPDRDKLCDFVKEYWHFDNITCMTEPQFIISYNNWAKTNRYRVSTVKAKILYTMAQDSIPTLSSSISSTKLLVLEAVHVLHMIDTTLVLLLSQMRTLTKSLKEYKTVMAMPGVGEILGPRIIAEIGDVRRFHSASALVAYAGLDAPPFQSGSYMAGKRSISKRGSSTLRKTGYEIMMYLKIAKPSQDNAVYLFMLKKESEGKPLRVAKIAALNKFLHIYYARVKEIYN
ncbi:IS110 family transposase [Anaerocolumna sp. AGMB13025]|uniref:IS110 family transposase n=1 Tax=Anaerocolumna sp. AGMB13025 TaxID=3039116 RepID=UPI00241F0298|nr:IS110 family transposase [Anaerocolumna sp. AGMB13025]WFR57153.1 IS110 family transposase [Anaerocolumna sp. AGMB13025]